MCATINYYGLYFTTSWVQNMLNVWNNMLIVNALSVEDTILYRFTDAATRIAIAIDNLFVYEDAQNESC